MTTAKPEAFKHFRPAPTTPLREKLECEFWTYIENCRPSIWNNPTARLEAGRCLATAEPWREYDKSAPQEERGAGYWGEVAAWISSALTIETT